VLIDRSTNLLDPSLGEELRKHIALQREEIEAFFKGEPYSSFSGPRKKEGEYLIE
jgi:hypothetical protein